MRELPQPKNGQARHTRIQKTAEQLTADLDNLATGLADLDEKLHGLARRELDKIDRAVRACRALLEVRRGLTRSERHPLTQGGGRRRS